MRYQYRKATISGDCTCCYQCIERGEMCVYVGWGGDNKTHLNCMPKLIEEASKFFGETIIKMEDDKHGE